jgi:hypothetical protein
MWGCASDVSPSRQTSEADSGIRVVTPAVQNDLGDSAVVVERSPTMVIPVPAKPASNVFELAATTHRWTVEVLHTIGSEREPYLFSLITAGFFLSDNRIVLVDDGMLNIKFFDEAGGHTKTVGGNGQGPGEFRRMAGAVLASDTIILYDRVNRRLTIVSPAGGIVRDYAVDVYAAPGGSQLRIIGRTRAGAFVVVQPAELPTQSGFHRDTVAIVLWDGTTITDTVGLIPDAERHREISSVGGGPQIIIRRLFMPNSALVAMSGDVIFAASSDAYEMVLFNHGGTYDLLRRSDVPPRILRRSDYETAVHDLVASSDDVTVAVKEEWTKMAKAQPLRSAPLIDALVVGNDGSIWVRDYATKDKNRWTIYSQAGGTLAFVDLPAQTKLLSATKDRVLLRSIDDMGVNQAIIASIRKQ